MYSETCKIILDECESALLAMDKNDIDSFINVIMESEKIFFTGVGRVLLSLKSIAKRYAHLGMDTHIVGEVTEPAITGKDVLIVASGSGESIIPVAISQRANEIGAKIVHIGSNPQNSITPYCSLFIRIPVQTKLYLTDEITSKQPMSSLFEQSLLLFGDIVAKMIVDEKKVDLKSLWQYHANLE